jgi:Flp pilus assembly secretin CpaC
LGVVNFMKQFSTSALQGNARAFLRAAAHGSRLTSAFLFSLLLTGGCTGGGIETGTPLERTIKVDNGPAREETVRGTEDPPIVTLQLGKALRQNNLRPVNDLPRNIKIGATNLNNVPVTVALQAVMADTDITLLWENEEMQNSKVTLLNLKGPLPVVVERICRAAKILCAYRNGALELTTQDTFVVGLPPIPQTMGDSSGAAAPADTISTAIESLIDGKVQVEEAGGNLIFTTNAEGHERVQAYLEQLRNGRPLIVLQLYIWEVTLDNSRQLGVNWSSLKVPDIGGPTQNLALSSSSALKSVAAGTGISLGAVFSGVIDANTVASFLATQGKVQNVSSPQLTFISGSSAKFEVGGKRRYVSQIGTLVSSTVGGTTTTNGVSNNTVSTEELSTGLTITTNGSYEGGVVFAGLEIKTSDLVRVLEVKSGDTTLQLPETSDRIVQTVLRVRPGDNLVLAGLQTTRDTRAREGLPLGSSTLPFYSQNDTSNTELVLLVRPSVVFFSDRDAPDLKKMAEEEEALPPKAAAVSTPIATPEAVATVASRMAPENIQPEVAYRPLSAVTPTAQTPVPQRPHVIPASAPASPRPSAPVAPGELQGEFGTVVRHYENEVVAPVAKGAPASGSNVASPPGMMPQNLVGGGAK